MTIRLRDFFVTHVKPANPPLTAIGSEERRIFKEINRLEAITGRYLPPNLEP